MRTAQPAIASSPRVFGRRPVAQPSLPEQAAARPAVSDDLRLFAVTFVAGFLFISILVA